LWSSKTRIKNQIFAYKLDKIDNIEVKHRTNRSAILL